MGAREAVAGRVSRGKEEGGQGLLTMQPPGRGQDHAVASPRTAGGTRSSGPEGSRGLIGGLATPARQVLPTA